MNTGALTWITTWIVAITLLVALAGTRWGRPLVYYALWLMVVILLVSHAGEVTSLINVNALQLNG